MWPLNNQNRYNSGDEDCSNSRSVQNNHSYGIIGSRNTEVIIFNLVLNTRNYLKKFCENQKYSLRTNV